MLMEHAAPDALVRVQGGGWRMEGWWFRVQGSQGSGFRVQGSGFRVQGSGFRVEKANACSLHARTLPQHEDVSEGGARDAHGARRPRRPGTTLSHTTY